MFDVVAETRSQCRRDLKTFFSLCLFYFVSRGAGGLPGHFSRKTWYVVKITEADTRLVVRLARRAADVRLRQPQTFSEEKI